MQIVIDIPEIIYDEIRNRTEGKGILECNSKNMLDAIYNGTPLPKGHERLVDANEVKRPFLHKKGDVFTAFHFFDAVDSAPTIIEADKESED